jgi:hypothetical protein
MEQPSLLRIKPNDPTNSYLIQKIEGAAGRSGQGLGLAKVRSTTSPLAPCFAAARSTGTLFHKCLSPVNDISGG